MDLQKYAQYVAANHPGCRVRKTGRGVEVIDPSGATPPTIDQAALDAWQPSPVATVAAALAARERAAADTITNLKASAAVTLVGGGMSQTEAYAAGTALVVAHSARIQAFVLAGGNALAGQSLLDAIKADPPAWWSSGMEAIFTAGLGL